MSKTHLTEQKFSDFALHPKVVEALEKKGFHNCTPIQALALPLTLEGRDVAGQAQTGTGKTMSGMSHSMGGMKMVGMEHNDPNSVLIEPGSTQELIWTFNDSTGLQFACNVPGHYQSGMVGQFDLK